MSEAYRNAGVDIDAGNEAVERMKKHVQKTMRPEVLTNLGGFGALFQLNTKNMQEPVLVSGTDGVGTKLMIAFAMDKHDTIGIDAVAMCVNDVIVQGAEPLFFLDYLACGKVKPEKIEAIVKGIAAGCELSGCALIGGETAEMPGMYAEDEYDIAGFTVGIVDRQDVIDGSSISEGDVLIGLASSGVHSNGFSLVRKTLLEDAGMSLHEEVDTLGETLGATLLTPTRIYVKPLLELMKEHRLKGLIHVTGGGFYDNIPRILPKGLQANVEQGSWPTLPIFDLIQEKGRIPDRDMYRTFNMGIGMIVVVKKEEAEAVLEKLASLGEQAYQIGQITAGQSGVELVGGN
ncbi:phosphoribosylformylglycinamidine cyclo-ligase [Ammoniphilus oxalaticus]|uniref:Phosphoribosylformylglycinamidine cyclo-ligase n=1 Tax=Ammoniphilus oxalaticus TaxID=66863 RepID=A0A419SDB2_9BACL|nr:phosphoribosylformylglycinamidine cyclo-ligase [Ammoniphilus oxalaticus]RKD21088.1 phosphoribosylformylglycinamidine cyclo-ligase [Ammoniphilus oxalaticus]